MLSGLATGASWLCYFKALQLGDINKVVPIDKSSTVLTILLAFLLLGEPIGLPQGIGVVLIGAGLLLWPSGKRNTSTSSVSAAAEETTAETIQAEMEEIYKEVRNSAYEIISRKGATYYASPWRWPGSPNASSWISRQFCRYPRSCRAPTAWRDWL